MVIYDNHKQNLIFKLDKVRLRASYIYEHCKMYSTKLRTIEREKEKLFYFFIGAAACLNIIKK